MPLQNRVTPFGEIVAIPERGTLMGNRGILHDAHQQIRRRWAGRAWISCLLEFQGRRDPVMAPGHYTRLFFLDEPTAFAAGHRPCAYCRRKDYLHFRATWTRANAHLGLGTAPRATEIDRVLHAERLDDHGGKRLHLVELAGLPDGVMVTRVDEGDDPLTPRPHGSEHSEHAFTDTTSDRVGDRVGAGLAPPAPHPAAPADHPAPPTTTPGGRGKPRPYTQGVPPPAAYLIWQGRLWRWSPAGYERTDYPLTGAAWALTPPTIIAALAAGYPTMPPVGLPRL